MANYYASARTNYFAVRDESAFRAFAAQFPDVEIVSSTVGNQRHPLHSNALAPELPENLPLFGLLFSQEVGIPKEVLNPNTDTWEDIDFPDALSTHVAPGWVAELREVGAEKLRYLVGYSIAVNSDGRRVDINLDNLSAKVSALGAYYTHPTY